MGVVYEAVDSVIERTVAIKTIRKGDLDADEAAEHGRRFLIEAKAAGKLNHPNIVGLYDHGDEAGLAYLVMELVQGRELQHYFNEHYPFTLADIVRLMGELLDALGYSHRRGVIHRDVKPANIFITDSGHVKLGDFGIARIESSTKTRVGAVLGTPSHMAPEQIRGEGADARSDLYAAGVVLFQFLTGERPFTGPMLSMALKVLNEPAPAPSSIRAEVSAAMDAVVARALAKQPADRYQTAADFWRALLEASGLAAAGSLPGGTLTGDAAESGFGRSTFGDTGFGRSGFGDTGFGRGSFGDTGIGRTGVGTAADATATGRPDGHGAAPAAPEATGASTATPPAIPAPGRTPPAPVASPRPATPPATAADRTPPPPVPARNTAGAAAPRPAPARSGAALWLGAAALAAVLGVVWWAARPAAPPAAPQAKRDTPARSDTTPPAPAPSASVVAQPAPTASASAVAHPAPAPAPASTPAPGLPPPPPTAAATPAPALPASSASPAPGVSAPQTTAVAPPPATRPPPRPVREARVPRPAAEALPSPSPKPARPARCSDILQKASLEPLTSEEAAYLRRECQ